MPVNNVLVFDLKFHFLKCQSGGEACVTGEEDVFRILLLAATCRLWNIEKGRIPNQLARGLGAMAIDSGSYIPIFRKVFSQIDTEPSTHHAFIQFKPWTDAT